MANNIKSAFAGICAEEKLKSDTMQYLEKERARRKKAQGHRLLPRYALTLASVMVLLMSGIFTYSLYITPVAFIDVDVNPSIELVLNRFDRVIGFYAYNDDGVDIVNGLSLTHKSYEDALVVLMEAMTRQGYFQEGALVSVTLQTDDKGKEKALLDNIQTGIEGYMTGHHHTAQIDIFPVSSDIRSHSHAQGVSPAKYLAIQELIEVDPAASVERCRNHSISEIKQLTQEHESHHNHSGGDGCNGSATNGDSSYEEEGTQPLAQENGHHSANNGNGRHHGRGH